MPGLRRLRDPCRDAELHAGARHRARAARLRLRDRLRGALPVLHADVRDALDSRARAGDRHRAGLVAAGPVGLGRDRRRRRALDRRQSPDPRAAPQRQRQDPALQQPDLRADQGAVLADERARQGDEVDADGLARLPVQPGFACDRRGGDVRGPVDRHRPQAPDLGAAPRGRPQGHRLRRDLPELQHLQRRRLRRGQGPPREPDPPRARPSDPLRRGRRARRRPARRRLVRARRRGRRGGGRAARPRRAPRGVQPRVRALAHRPHAAGADADRRLPRRRAPGLRPADGRADRDGEGEARARATSASSSTPATPGRSRSSEGQAS